METIIGDDTASCFWHDTACIASPAPMPDGTTVGRLTTWPHPYPALCVASLTGLLADCHAPIVTSPNRHVPPSRPLPDQFVDYFFETWNGGLSNCTDRDFDNVHFSFIRVRTASGPQGGASGGGSGGGSTQHALGIPWAPGVPCSGGCIRYWARPGGIMGPRACCVDTYMPMAQGMVHITLAPGPRHSGPSADCLPDRWHWASRGPR